MTGKSNIFSEANHEYLLTFLDDLANRHGEESRQLHNELKIIKGDIENIYEDFKDSILKTRQEIQTEIRGELEYTLKRMKNITEVQQDEIRSLMNELGSLHRKVDSNSKKHNKQLSVLNNILNPVSNITSLNSYLNMLNDRIDNMIIFIVSYNNPCGIIGDTNVKLLQGLGLRISKDSRYRYA